MKKKRNFLSGSGIIGGMVIISSLIYGCNKLPFNMFDREDERFAYVIRYEKETSTFEDYTPTNTGTPKSVTHNAAQMQTVKN